MGDDTTHARRQRACGQLPGGALGLHTNRYRNASWGPRPPAGEVNCQMGDKAAKCRGTARCRRLLMVNSESRGSGRERTHHSTTTPTGYTHTHRPGAPILSPNTQKTWAATALTHPPINSTTSSVYSATFSLHVCGTVAAPQPAHLKRAHQARHCSAWSGT
jgi:hypothetical protein